MFCPLILIHGSYHGLLVGQHLSQAVAIDDLDVSEVSQNFEDRPLIGSGFVAESLWRQTRNGCGNFFRALLCHLEMRLKFGFSHNYSKIISPRSHKDKEGFFKAN